jgi:hypothetical protein
MVSPTSKTALVFGLVIIIVGAVSSSKSFLHESVINEKIKKNIKRRFVIDIFVLHLNFKYTTK